MTRAIRTESLIGNTRRLSAIAGLAALLALSFIPEGSLAERVATAAAGAFGLAIISGFLHLLFQGRPPRPPLSAKRKRGSKAWTIAGVGVALVAGIAVQTWFRSDTTIGGGDVASAYPI